MKRATAGFTLIEVLVAMVIFSISSLAVTSLMVGSMQHISGNGLRSEAISLAQDAIEGLRSAPYDDLATGSELDVLSSKGGTTFDVNWRVHTDDPMAGVKRIVVTVTWDHKGVARTYETETIYTNIVRS
ncbi:MAG: type II secretion system protein [Deltaproteobacteria bacterium]|nr:type II secretion system protein [Deltaproteobacteria bacterium]